MWICKICNKEIEDDFDSCWNCHGLSMKHDYQARHEENNVKLNERKERAIFLLNNEKEVKDNLTLGDKLKNFVHQVVFLLIILGFIVFLIYAFLFGSYSGPVRI